MSGTAKSTSRATDRRGKGSANKGKSKSEFSPHVARKRAERWRQILQAAAQVFAENGYDRTNLSDIAERFQMSGSSLYYYVKSKEELALACLSSIGKEVIDRQRAIAEGEGTPIERLRRMFREQVLIEIRDYPQFSPLFAKLVVYDAPLVAEREAVRKRHGDIFRKVADEAVAAGELREKGTHTALLLAIAALALLQDWHRADGGLEPEPFADHIADQLMRMF